MNIHYNAGFGSAKSTTTDPHKTKSQQFLNTNDLLDIPIPESNPDFSDKYPVEFISPDVDEGFVDGIKDSPEAEQRVSENADAEYQTANPFNRESLGKILQLLYAKLEAYKKEWMDAEQQRQQEPAFEGVVTNSPKLENARYPFISSLFLVILLFSGIAMMGATVSAFITQSDKIPIVYDHPYIALLFGFLPLGIMVMIAQAYSWVKTDRYRRLFLWVLFLLVNIAFIGWLTTFGPAYAESSIDTDDLAALVAFDFFTLHISIQLLGEVLLGALIKVGLQINDRNYRKSEPYETTARKRHRAHIAQIQALCIPILAEIDALTKHCVAYEAGLISHRNDYLALLDKKRREQQQRNDAADAAGNAARASYKH